MLLKKIHLPYVVFATLILTIHAASISNANCSLKSLSFQGFTGLINSPNACVTREGSVDLLYSNQIEQERRVQNTTDNYIFSLGLFSNIEIGGRFVEEEPHAPKGLRDLSGNIKFQVPFISSQPIFPKIACGIQDWGGGAANFRTYYGVISKNLWHSRLSVGYGDGPDLNSMDGFFGGIECFIFDWFHFILENDSKEINAGIRLTTFGNQHLGLFRFAFTGKTCFDHDPGDFEFSFLCQMPLGRLRAREKDLSTNPAHNDTYNKTDENSLSAFPQELLSSESSEHKASRFHDNNITFTPKTKLINLKRKLIAHGFENVKIGICNETSIYIEYENNRFNRNELDGLGLLLGIASHNISEDLETIRIIVKKNNLPILQLSAPTQSIEAFFDADEPPAHVVHELKNKLIIQQNNTKEHLVEFLDGSGNPSFFKPRLFLYPGLKTFIGTEEGAFNGLLSLKPELVLPLWIGNELDFRWDIPLCWSSDFDDGGPFVQNRNDAMLERAMVHQAFTILPYLNTMLSGGLYQYDVYGVMGETIWTSSTGRHRLRIKGGTFENKNSEKKNDVYIGGYRFFFSPLCLFFEISGGKYWYQDKGYTFELKRFFKDTCITLFYQDTEEPIGGKAAGIKISLPLTPRRDMNPSYFQIKGSDQWSYHQQTTVHEQGEGNPINMNIAIEPKTARSLERVYYNRDRFNELYIKNHLIRMWDAYRKYYN